MIGPIYLIVLEFTTSDIGEKDPGVTFDEFSLDNFLEALDMEDLDYCLEDEHGNRILLYDFDEFA